MSSEDPSKLWKTKLFIPQRSRVRQEATCIPYCAGGLNHPVDKDLKRHKDWKGGNKLFVEDMIIHVKVSRISVSQLE